MNDQFPVPFYCRKSEVAASASILIFSLIWAWINRWVNNREADDLRRQRAHYDVNVMDDCKDDIESARHTWEYTCYSEDPIHVRYQNLTI